MEDALVPMGKSYMSYLKVRLNPCFNGRCTRTRGLEAYMVHGGGVLILVLMEDALVQNKKL